MKLQIAAIVVAALVGVSSEVHSAPHPGLGTWEATLQARDLDNNGIVDAYYDSALDITWATMPFMGWWQTVALNVAAYKIGDFTGWRLPKRDINCDYSSGFCKGNEMDYLLNIEAPSLGSNFNNSGWFPDLLPSYYAEDVFTSGGSSYSAYSFGSGTSYEVYKRFTIYGLAVHDGDLMPPMPISEPSSFMIALLGVGCVVLRKRVKLFDRRTSYNKMAQ